jgi:4-hydroxy-tetrahydrodipicolinate synthase
MEDDERDDEGGKRRTTMWSGIIPALVTPLTPQGEVDERALRRVIEFTITHGVRALSVLGSTGEGPLLPAPVQRRVLEVALEARGDRPILAGILVPVPQDALDLARLAFDRGIDGVLVAPPYYYPLDQHAVGDFYAYLDRNLSGPVFIYHIPQFTKVPLEPDTVAQVADLPRIAGIKDSSRDIEFHRGIVDATRGKEFAVFAGSGAQLSTNIMAGGAGAIAASANVIPGALGHLWEALRRGDVAEGARWQQHVSSVEAAVRQFPFPANWKACLELMGLLSAEPTFPFRRLSGAQMSALRTDLHALGVVPLRV